MKYLNDFASDQNFLDQLKDREGNSLKSKRFDQIIKECWFISDNLHTSYTEALDMSITERITLIRLINTKNKATEEAVKAATNKQEKL